MNEQRKPKEQSRVWRWRRAIGGSDLHATTRHILQVLSEFMSVNGDSCFPSINDVSQKSGRDRKTVREHLESAERAGWLVVESAGWSGPQHARKSYVARWPDNLCDDTDSGDDFDSSALATDGELDPDRWGETPQPDGAGFPAYKTSPQTSPNTTPDKDAGAGAVSVADRVRIRKQFLEWFPTYPGYSNYSDGEARKQWFKLSDRERRDCIRKTDAYVRALGKGIVSSPAHYLRDRAWEGLTAEELVPEKIDAKPFSLLWMVTFYSLLLQPPTGNYVITAFERGEIASRRRTEDDVRNEKLSKYGWPNVMTMLRNLKKTDLHACPSRLQKVATSEILRPVDPESELYAAWRRHHARRGWPFFPFAPGRIHLPFVDVTAPDLNAAVDAAMTEFETLIAKA